MGGLKYIANFAVAAGIFTAGCYVGHTLSDARLVDDAAISEKETKLGQVVALSYKQAGQLSKVCSKSAFDKLGILSKESAVFAAVFSEAVSSYDVYANNWEAYEFLKKLDSMGIQIVPTNRTMWDNKISAAYQPVQNNPDVKGLLSIDSYDLKKISPTIEEALWDMDDRPFIVRESRDKEYTVLKVKSTDTGFVVQPAKGQGFPVEIDKPFNLCP